MMPLARSVVLAKVRAKYLRRETALPVLMRPGETQTLLNAADRYFINPGAVVAIITLIIIIVLHLYYSLFLTADTVPKSYYILVLCSMCYIVEYPVLTVSVQII